MSNNTTAHKNIPIEEMYKLYLELRSFRKVAKVLGCNKSNVSKRLGPVLRETGEANLDRAVPNYTPGAGRRIARVSAQLDKNGEAKGYSVTEAPLRADKSEFAPALGQMHRVSTLLDATGAVTQQWQISVQDKTEVAKAFEQTVEAMKEELPRAEPVSLLTSPAREANMHNLYVLSDAHIGALTWRRESGEAWDLKIAENMLVAAHQQMMAHSPAARDCTIALLGDWTHYDKLEAVTTMSGNILDADGRSPKMNQVAIRTARRVINEALKRHEHVTLLVAEGNHDLIASYWLRALFLAVYENEPRITVVDDPRPYYAVSMGDVLLGFHHGHLKNARQAKNAESLVALFADEFREQWGRAKKVYIHTGHLHHATEHECRGARIFQHPTLAGRSSWEARHGWGSLREARAITYHTQYGQMATVSVSPEMLDTD